MQVVSTLANMRDLGRNLRNSGKRVGFVPTMGAFHRGHERLMQEARKRSDIVVVSSFVNPMQFDDAGDLSHYPITPEADQRIAERNQVDYLFTPSNDQMFPAGFLTTVNVAFLTSRLEGESRVGHFRGVCTVVLKLFNIVQPAVAFFGWKDAQQFIVLRHMVRDLALDIEMVAVPTVRDADGLALSSRNVRLTPEQREQALVLNRALRRCHFLVKKQNITHCGELHQAIRSALGTSGAKIEYAAIVNRATLEPLDMIEHGNTLVVLAIRVGDVRLIDNTRF